MNILTSKVATIMTATAVTLSACAGSVSKQEEQTGTDRKAEVTALLKAIETGASEPLAYIDGENYKQHNLAAEDGLSGLRKFLAAFDGIGKVKTVRVFQDGDYVFAHTDYSFFGPMSGIDIFRYENGKIVEHWDNVQEKPEGLNPSGHSMTDGTTELKDLDKTDANKQLVQSFVEDILRDGKMEKLTSYFDGDNYIQHNPAIGDGLSGLGAALEAMAKQGVTMKYDRIHKVLGEGNFVLVVSEGSFAGKHTSFYDLFRVENGKIAEHWDTIEIIAPESEHKNANGKFNF